MYSMCWLKWELKPELCSVALMSCWLKQTSMSKGANASNVQLDAVTMEIDWTLRPNSEIGYHGRRPWCLKWPLNFKHLYQQLLNCVLIKAKWRQKSFVPDTVTLIKQFRAHLHTPIVNRVTQGISFFSNYASLHNYAHVSFLVMFDLLEVSEGSDHIVTTTSFL